MKPRLVMTLLVRDEADIVEKTICFHLNHGVDFIVAIDNGSIDGSPQILEKYARKGVLSYSTIKEYTFQQAEWVSKMAHIAVKKHGATHLFHCDADEFWYPSSGNLKDHLPKGNEVFYVRVVNYLPENQPFRLLSRRRTIVENPYSRIADRLRDKSSRYLLFPLPHKIMTTAAFTQLAQGNHGVVTKRKIKKVYIRDVFIHHFPIRSYKQFSSKVINGGSAYEKNPDKNPDMGWQWKSWYALYKKGLLRKLYADICISQKERAVLLKKGMLKTLSVPLSIQFAKMRYKLHGII